MENNYKLVFEKWDDRKLLKAYLFERDNYREEALPVMLTLLAERNLDTEKGKGYELSESEKDIYKKEFKTRFDKEDVRKLFAEFVDRNISPLMLFGAVVKVAKEYPLVDMTEANREVLSKLSNRREMVQTIKWIAYLFIVIIAGYFISKGVGYMAIMFIPILFLVHILTSKKLASGNFKLIEEDLRTNKKKVKRGIVRNLYVGLQNPPDSKIGKMHELYKLNSKSDMELVRNDPAFISKTDFKDPLLFSYNDRYCCKINIEAEDGTIYDCLSHCNTISHLTVKDKCWIEVAAKSDIPVNIMKF